MPNPWHLKKSPDNLLKASYIEWKYFNFSAPSVSGIFVYAIFDPLNITSIGGGRMVARIFRDKKIFGGAKRISMKKISASDSSAEIKMDDFGSIAVNKNNYVIKGKLGGVSWNLKYSPLAQPIRGFSNLGLDFLNLEKASWEIKMPKAKVSGTVKIGKKRFSVRSFGYTDANWGNFIPITAKFNWAQYNDGKISIVAGETESMEIRGKKIGRWTKIYVTFGRQKIAFLGKNVSIKRDKWMTIPGTNMKAPSIASIQAENKQYALRLEARSLFSDPIRFEMPFSLPFRPVILEQPAIFAGALFKKSGSSLKPVCKIKRKGFMECTLREIGFSKKLKVGILV